jgi:hypothetical protein
MTDGLAEGSSGATPPPPEPSPPAGRLPGPGRRGAWFRRFGERPSGWTIAYAVVLTGIVLVVGTSGPWSPVGFAEHRTCLASLDLQNDLLWTPVALENSPYGGWARTSAVTSENSYGFETVGLNDSSGSASGVFSLDNWSIFRESNVTTLGPGPNLRCGGAFTAVDETRAAGKFSGQNVSSAMLLAPGAESDANEPTQVNLSAPIPFFREALFPSTIFDDRFVAASSVTSTCTGPSSASTWSSAVTELKVPYTAAGSTVLIPVVLPALVSYTYGVGDSPGGMWSIDTSSGFGPSFSWTACG